MGIVKRIIIFLLIVGAANYGLYYIFTAVGAAPRDIMPHIHVVQRGCGVHRRTPHLWRERCLVPVVP